MSILERIRNEYGESKQREALLTRDYVAGSAQLSGESQKAVQYSILKREVDTYRQLYESMLHRVKEAGLASALRATNIRVVDLAEEPGAPYKPLVARTAALGAVGALLAGSMVVVIRGRADRALRGPGDVSLHLNLPELGVIPAARRRRAALGSGAPPECLELVTTQDGRSAVADSFRAVLTSLLFSGGMQQRCVVVTSASPSEGKTTVATNLAVAMAEVGRKVLLIDGDMRRPRLHTIFRLKNESGLSTLLRDGCVQWRDLAQPTPAGQLFVIPSGPTPLSAANLLISGPLPELLRQAAAEYDAVIVDSPPMLQLPDARIIGRAAGAVMLVVRAGKTSRDAGSAITRRLREDGVSVLGAVINAWDPGTSPNGYYGYYRGYHGAYAEYGGKATSSQT